LNNLTQTVLILQTVEKDSYEWDLLFSQVYAGIEKLADRIVETYREALKGDLHHGYSEAHLLLIKSIETFVYRGYEFTTYYRRVLKNRLVDLKRTAAADKNKPHSDYSLDFTRRHPTLGYTYSVFDKVPRLLQTVDTYHKDAIHNLDNLIDEYRIENPKEADVIDIFVTYAAEGYCKSDLTAALADHYGSAEYTGKIQRRVSRIRQAFKEFLLDRGISLSF
jgi:DNA-directed RNA polymerase specialized sigma24 family protein